VADQDMSTPTNQRTDATTADLLRQLSEQTTRLVSQEIELAKAEVSEKGKKAGIGAGMFGGAGLFGLYALGALIATAIAALSLGMDTWIAALIVTVVLGAIAGILALQGRSKLKSAMPPAPEATIETVREDVQTTKEAAQRGRSGA